MDVNISENDNSLKIDLGLIINVSLRLILLGGLIFLATTYIPQTELPFDSRVTISVVVVLIYSMIDIIGNILYKIRRQLCSWFCGCDTNANSNYVYQ